VKWINKGFSEERLSYLVENELGSLVCELFVDRPDVKADKVGENAELISKAPQMRDALATILFLCEKMENQADASYIRTLIERVL